MKAKPYVGITGVANQLEVDNVIKEFEDSGYTLKSRHLPMLGFLVSLKTLNGQETSNRRYPKFKNLRHLVERTKNKVSPMVHYNSGEKTTLSEQLDKLFYSLYHDNLCKAVQLNIIYPDIKEIIKTKAKMPYLRIVFQISNSMIEGKTSKQLAKSIKGYNNLVDYVLIDPSGGKGREFDLEHSVDIYNELKENFPNLTVGFVGGFRGENVVSRVKDIMDRIKNDDFCIDAEGGLRDKISDDYGDDLLNMNKVKKYLQEASVVLN